MCAKFQPKSTTWLFQASIYQKMGLGFAIQKTNVGIRINILEIPCVPIFRKNKQVWLLWPKYAQKWILGSEFQKSKSGFGISNSKIPIVAIFSQMDNFEFFSINLGKLPNYLQYFGSNNVERAGLRLQWTRWRWIELGEGEWRWMKLGRGGWRWIGVVRGEWSWVKVGVRFKFNKRLDFLMINHAVSRPSSFWQGKWAATGVWLCAFLIYF